MENQQMEEQDKHGEQEECVGEFTVKNPRGLHARPGGDLIKLANSFPCEVYFGKNGKMVNGKSMIGLLSLGPKFGDRLTVRTKGERAREAFLKLGEMIESVLE
jgi:phosphocarrier protein